MIFVGSLRGLMPATCMVNTWRQASDSRGGLAERLCGRIKVSDASVLVANSLGSGYQNIIRTI